MRNESIQLTDVEPRDQTNEIRLNAFTVDNGAPDEVALTNHRCHVGVIVSGASINRPYDRQPMRRNGDSKIDGAIECVDLSDADEVGHRQVAARFLKISRLGLHDRSSKEA
jgi:hypothetical protein